MKKILLLGGSAQQVVAIETAKRLGYYTVLCDYLSDNPGQFVADRFYLVSTTDKEAVLDVARREAVDGVLAYASDPAAPTAAYVAEQLGLPGNPFVSVDILCNKDKFRHFLKENGFHAPEARGYSSTACAMEECGRFRLPVIIKPVDSSGSKGVTVLRTLEGLREAVEFAFSFSRSHHVIIEEYIEKKHPYLIGGDVFIADGKIIMWGLMNCHRDLAVNPLVPVGKSYPLRLDAEDVRRVKDTLQRMVDRLHMTNGAMNVELVIDQENRVWPIDIGPRSGGNMIPDLLGMIFGIDVVEMSVLAAMGEKFETTIRETDGYYATHNLHATQSGVYSNIVFDEAIQPYMMKACLYKKCGDPVEFFDNASKALGIVFLKFETQEQMEQILAHISEHIDVQLQGEGANR